MLGGQNPAPRDECVCSTRIEHAKMDLCSMLDPYYNMIQHGYGVLWFHIEIWLAMDAHLDGKISVSYRMPRILLRLLRLRLRFPLSDESRESPESPQLVKSEIQRSQWEKHGKTSFENLCHSTYPSYLDHFRSIYSTPQLGMLGISPPFPLISSGVQGNDCSPKPLTYLDQCCHAKHLLRLRFLSSLESPAVHIPSFVAKMQNVD